MSGKTGMLLIRYRAMQTRLERLAAENREMRSAIVAKDAELERLRIESEYLKVATTLAPDPIRKDEVFALLTNLVREIDRCIANLNE